jgi:hypothetical protein
MTLSDNDRAALRSRYVSWGVDTVRQDLRRPLRHAFVSKDVNDFAREWVEETDEKEIKHEARNDRLMKILMIVAAIEFGIGVGMNIPV